MTPPKTAYERAREWWDTEPFGFDHPVTFGSVLRLMEESERIGAEREREACAKIADRNDQNYWGIAVEIRARGTKQNVNQPKER